MFGCRRRQGRAGQGRAVLGGGSRAGLPYGFTSSQSDSDCSWDQQPRSSRDLLQQGLAAKEELAPVNSHAWKVRPCRVAGICCLSIEDLMELHHLTTGTVGLELQLPAWCCPAVAHQEAAAAGKGGCSAWLRNLVLSRPTLLHQSPTYPSAQPKPTPASLRMPEQASQPLSPTSQEDQPQPKASAKASGPVGGQCICHCLNGYI